MNTWIFSRLQVLPLVALAACGTEQGAGSFLQGINLQSSGGFRRDVSQPDAKLMAGRLHLVPPDGYCVNKRGLKDDFATLARCDTLGAGSGSQGAPLGLITVSVVAATEDVSPVETVNQLVGDAARVQPAEATEGGAVVQIKGGRLPGAEAVYWRGVVQREDLVLSLAAYAPEGGTVAASTGKTLLEQVMTRATAQKPAPDTAETVAETAPPDTNGLGARIRGLFNRKALAE